MQSQNAEMDMLPVWIESWLAARLPLIYLSNTRCYAPLRLACYNYYILLYCLAWLAGYCDLSFGFIVVCQSRIHGIQVIWSEFSCKPGEDLCWATRGTVTLFQRHCHLWTGFELTILCISSWWLACNCSLHLTPILYWLVVSKCFKYISDT
jgi:hypothetical protein